MSGSGACIYRFGDYELDPARFELRFQGSHVHVEPQVLSLLILLAGNPARLVSKDEIIEQVWDGRVVSESAIAARIKAARKAIGDDGSQQRLIRTVHGKGFRFVAEVRVEPPEAPSMLLAEIVEGRPAEDVSDVPPADLRNGRPSIAVLPFTLTGEPGPHDVIADALPQELIMDLSRLRWLFVIARGSSFRFRGLDVDATAAARSLGVRYCLTGTIERTVREISVGVTLADAADGGVVWGERFRGSIDELQLLSAEILDHTVASLAVEIPQNEVRLARGRPIAELDSWAAFHMGLNHMFRFNKADNSLAAQLFEQALARDPYFARALGGLSFTHFQNAFLLYREDPAAEAEKARELAHRAVECDRMDPFAHFNIGRSFWLDGRLSDSIDWFDRATALSPSFAQGIYNRGLVGTMTGQAEQADRDLALALQLSPLDPLSYAMVSSRALTHIQFGDLEKAAELGSRAALMPGAHKHIELIAALTAHLAGRESEAQTWLGKARTKDASMGKETFFRSFPFAPGEARDTIEKGLTELGL